MYPCSCVCIVVWSEYKCIKGQIQSPENSQWIKLLAGKPNEWIPEEVWTQKINERVDSSHCLEQDVMMCHWAVRQKTTASGKPSLRLPVSPPKKPRLSCTTPAHTDVNAPAFHIWGFRNVNLASSCILPQNPFHTYKRNPHLQQTVTKHHCRAAEQSLRDAHGCFSRLSCSSEHQTQLRTMTEQDEMTVSATEASAGLSLPKSCINNSVIGHRFAATLCNPRSTIILHCFVHVCHHNAWTGARCNFLIDPRRFFHIIRFESSGWASKVFTRDKVKITMWKGAGFLVSSAHIWQKHSHY